MIITRLPPKAFSSTVKSLGESGLNRSSGWTRLVIEKPFGRDAASAQKLNKLIHKYYDESQIYRIDHFLAKETVQNLLVFRFANTIFEHLWNRDHIEKVEIIVSEKLGIEGRANYYEQTGALRDMISNHLTQLLSLVAMDTPSGLDAGAGEVQQEVLLGSGVVPEEVSVREHHQAGHAGSDQRCSLPGDGPGQRSDKFDRAERDEGDEQVDDGQPIAGGDLEQDAGQGKRQEDRDVVDQSRGPGPTDHGRRRRGGGQAAGGRLEGRGPAQSGQRAGEGLDRLADAGTEGPAAGP